MSNKSTERQWYPILNLKSGAKVKLLRDLTIWAYKPEEITWKVFRNWETDEVLLPKDSEGTVTDKVLDAGTGIQFGTFTVYGIPSWLYEPK